MLKATRRRPALALLAVLCFTAIPFLAAADSDEDDDRVVIRSLSNCPDIKILSTSGEPIQWVERASRGFLGVELTPLTRELREHFGVPGDAGVMIGRVVEDSAAAQAGLQVGDIVTHIDGEEITSAGDLGRAVRQKEGGETVTVELWRDDGLQTFAVTLGEQERCAFDLSHLPRINLEELGTMGLKIGEETLESLRGIDWEETMEHLRAIDWEKHFEGLQMIDKERIERQMERTRERLERLEERLDREHERLERLERDEREKVERELEQAQRDLERAQRDREREERDSGSQF